VAKAELTIDMKVTGSGAEAIDLARTILSEAKTAGMGLGEEGSEAAVQLAQLVLQAGREALKREQRKFVYANEEKDAETQEAIRDLLSCCLCGKKEGEQPADDGQAHCEHDYNAPSA